MRKGCAGRADIAILLGDATNGPLVGQRSRRGPAGKALQFSKTMRSQFLTPDVITYNICCLVLARKASGPSRHASSSRCCSRDGSRPMLPPKVVDQRLRKRTGIAILQHSHWFTPDVISYLSLISACARGAQPEQTEQLVGTPVITPNRLEHKQK